MGANQSKHTVQFSDLSWPEGSSEFPRAWQIGGYLDRYLKTYCSGAKLVLGSRVEKAEPLASPNHASNISWRVQTRSSQGEVKEEIFDYLLVASGFFSKPALPPVSKENVEIPVLHSSQYRDLQSLLGKTDGPGGKILVVGGQMSGVEIAGTIASHLSSAVHSPNPGPVPNAEKYSIHHIVQKPVWVFPLYGSPKVCGRSGLQLKFLKLTFHSQPHLHPHFSLSIWDPTTSPTGSNPWSTRRDTSL